MPADYEQALAERRAGPAGPAGETGKGHRAGQLVRLLALPLTDCAGLVAAATISGSAHGVRAGLACAVYLAAMLAVLAASRLHRLRICLRVSDQADRILIAAVLPLPVVLAWLPAARVVSLALWSAGLVFACRVAVCAVLRAAHRHGRLTERTLVVGSGTFGAYVAGLIQEHPELGLRPLGFLDDGPPRRDLSLPSLGSPADLAQVVARLDVSRVIVCFSSSFRDEDMVAVIRASQPLRADVCIVPRLHELGMSVPRGCLDEIWGIPLIPLRRFGHSPTGRALKRACDLTVAPVLLAAAVPLVLALAAAIRLRTGQAALFRQTRMTGRGRVVPILKLRTLAGHDDPDTRWTTEQYSGRLGRFLRSTHADELPQLVNVVRGEMSLVGPRPERPYFAERFSREIPRYDGRTRMPAGMTGWAQVNGLNGDTSIFERARFDNYYVEYWSPWLDFVILARTLVAVACGRRQAR